jgi:AcrR family transcriptional regulator
MTTKAHVPRVKRPAAERLADALETLARRQGDATQKITVTELCRLANVSRNSLYRYHTTSLKALRKLQCRRTTLAASPVRKSDEQRRIENVALRDHLSKLAALVDHYYAAYQETATLLQRREGELATLHRKTTVRPTLREVLT